MTTTYTQHRVRLVGHRDLGTVRARWVGCILELEDGTRYGPSALFEVVPVAELVSKPAPPVQEPAPEPKPAAVLLRGWRMFGRGGWELWDTSARVHATVSDGGWACRGTASGPETGLRGKEEAVERLLNNGAKWESPDQQAASLDHDTRAIRHFRPDDVAVMVDGSKRTIEDVQNGIVGRLLFTDGSWLTHEAAETAIAARVPADDGIPF